MKRIIWLLTTLILFHEATRAQDMATLSGAQAKRLYVQIASRKNDTSKIEILLKLATYQIKKNGESRADLDSAADLIKLAIVINQKLKNKKSYGVIALVSSYLNEEQNHRVVAKKYANDAVSILTQTGTYYSLLGESYFQLSRFYSDRDSTLTEKEYDVSKAIFFFHKAGNPKREGDCHQFLGDLLSIEDKYSNSQKELLRHYKFSNLYGTLIRRVPMT